MSNPMIDFPDFGEAKKKLYISCPMKGRSEDAIRNRVRPGAGGYPYLHQA